MARASASSSVFRTRVAGHAAESARAALAFRDEFRAAAAARPESLGKVDLRIGISSGMVIASFPEDAGRTAIFSSRASPSKSRDVWPGRTRFTARRFCSVRALTARPGKRSLLARSISCAAPSCTTGSRVYELLSLAEKATPEEIARRDRFWTGIVYFRERRWNEAWTEFKRAQAESGAPDRPLQWYLRRLEPLCLQMATEPAPVAEPLVPL